MPTKAPANKKIMKTHEDSERDAAAVKKAVMLQPPAIPAPYPMRSPPNNDLKICLSESIRLNLNDENVIDEMSAPAKIPIFLKFDPMAAVLRSSEARMELSAPLRNISKISLSQ